MESIGIADLSFRRKTSMSYARTLTHNSQKRINRCTSVSVVVERHTSKSAKQEENFHSAISSILIAAQFLAILPVKGITQNDVSKLKFSWCNFRTLYTGLVIIGAIVTAIFSILYLSITGLTFATSSNTAFSLASLASLLLFLKLSTDWPSLQLEWYRVEVAMQVRHRPPRLKKKFHFIAATLLLLALVEHLLSNLHYMVNALECACCDSSNVFYALLIQNNRPVFSFVAYSHWKGVLLSIMSIIKTFSWNFSDVFIILISCALADRFEALNQQLHNVYGKVLSTSYWKTLREDYNLLACLTKRVDACVNKIVLLSFANNLYFICYQMLNSMRIFNNFSDALYFYWSIIYILLKTCAVSLCTASIHDQSLKPKPYLYAVPVECYCSEVQRFLFQLTTDHIALTGMNFFSVTRAFIMTVAGTIVTYEIVLMQFNTISDLSGNQASTTSNITEKCLWYSLGHE